MSAHSQAKEYSAIKKSKILCSLSQIKSVSLAFFLIKIVVCVKIY